MSILSRIPTLGKPKSARQAPPASQKAGARPISFVLDDQGISEKSTVSLWVRPEDLTRVDPSRLYVQQTLGPTAWADSFGAGITSITISGHTGWHRDMAGDGEARFKKLKEKVFDEWHRRRAAAVSAGRDPETVRLIFADALDGFTLVVAPVSFTLRRSRARPLLLQYQISMTVLDTNIARGMPMGLADALKSAEQKKLSGLDRLIDTLDKLADVEEAVKNFDLDALAGLAPGPLAGFVNKSVKIYKATDQAVRTGAAVADSLITIAKSVSRIGMNVFRTVSRLTGSNSTKAKAMQVAGAYSNAFCVLSNAFKAPRTFRDYSLLYGASNCSSTSGGRPPSALAKENPFYRVAPTQAPPPVQMTAAATESMRQLAAVDVVLSPMPSQQIGANLVSVVDGTQV